MSQRVIQWSTGNVGAYALRAILSHPELELAGVVEVVLIAVEDARAEADSVIRRATVGYSRSRFARTRSTMNRDRMARPNSGPRT